MSKKCTPLWREAHFEVKMCKTLRVRTTFGHSDVVSRGRRKGLCTFSKVSKTWGFCSISKNDGRCGTFEQDLQRCIFQGRRSTRDMVIRDVRRSGRWFPERGCTLVGFLSLSLIYLSHLSPPSIWSISSVCLHFIALWLHFFLQRPTFRLQPQRAEPWLSRSFHIQWDDNICGISRVWRETPLLQVVDFEDRRAQRESCTQCLRAQGTRTGHCISLEKKISWGCWCLGSTTPWRKHGADIYIYIYIYVIPVPGSLAPPHGMVYIDSQEDTNHRLNQ